jgi:hypothetical protein
VGSKAVFTTDVKRFKQPQIIINTDKLSTILMDLKADGKSSSMDIERKTLSKPENSKDVTITKTVEDLVSEKTRDGASKNSFNEAVNIVTESTMEADEKSKLYEKINEAFNKTYKVPTNTSINEIDFSKHFLKTPGTEVFIDSLNMLRDLSVSPDLRDLIWKTLLQRPESFTKSQHNRLNILTGSSVLDSNLTDVQKIERIKSVYKNKDSMSLLSKIKLIESLIPGTPSIFEGVEYLITKIYGPDNVNNYPIARDISPDNRAALLLGLLTKYTPNSVNNIFNKDQVNAFIVSDPTKFTEVTRWLNKALNIDDTKPFEGSTLPLSPVEISTLFSHDNVFELDYETISKNLYKLLYTNKDSKNYRKFLTKIGTDLNSIYYNTDIREHAGILLEALLMKDKAIEGTVDAQLDKVKLENKILKKETRRMKEEAKEVKTTLMSRESTGLSPEAQTSLNTIMESLGEDYLNVVHDFMNNKLTGNEDLRMIAELTANINKLTIPATTKLEIAKAIQKLKNNCE